MPVFVRDDLPALVGALGTLFALISILQARKQRRLSYEITQSSPLVSEHIGSGLSIEIR
jgi:hypothetical protein